MVRHGLSRAMACVLVVFVGAFALATENDAPKPDQKKRDTWTLDFKWQSPKTIKVRAADGGQTTIWYLRYAVTNNTPEARHFVPALGLSSDKSNTLSLDKCLPAVAEQIRAVEDPTGNVDLRDTVTISSSRIPPGKTVHGLAVWDAIDPATARFTIYARGLSNGHVVEKGRTWRKTLELKFERSVDPKRPGKDEIRLIAEEWVYREAPRKKE